MHGCDPLEQCFDYRRQVYQSCRFSCQSDHHHTETERSSRAFPPDWCNWSWFGSYQRCIGFDSLMSTIRNICCIIQSHIQMIYFSNLSPTTCNRTRSSAYFGSFGLCVPIASFWSFSAKSWQACFDRGPHSGVPCMARQGPKQRLSAFHPFV